MELTFSDVAPRDPVMEAELAPLLRDLRPGLGAEAFAVFAEEAYGQGLVFTAARDGAGRCVGLATHRVLATSRGRLLFVEDLVIDPRRRGGGIGAALFAELEGRARAAGCTRIELDSGTNKHAAHRFYRARGMAAVALHFARDAQAGPT